MPYFALSFVCVHVFVSSFVVLILWLAFDVLGEEVIKQIKNFIIIIIIIMKETTGKTKT
jgi:hypothetical protein